MRLTDEGSSAAADAYTLVGTQRTFRVNSDNSFTPIINVTAQSTQYGVVYTWTLLAATWDADGGPPLISQKTGEVNALCGHPHVQDFRTEQDQGPSNALYNFAVITVGTDDGQITDEARVRMDSIGLPAAFAAVDAVWARLAAAGAV